MKNSTIECPLCNAPVVAKNRAHRGLVVNAVASLNARLIANGEMLSLLKKRKKRDPLAELNLSAIIASDDELLKLFTEISTVCKF